MNVNLNHLKRNFIHNIYYTMYIPIHCLSYKYENNFYIIFSKTAKKIMYNSHINNGKIIFLIPKSEFQNC